MLRSSVRRTIVLLVVSLVALGVSAAAAAAGERAGWWGVIGSAVLTAFMCLLLVRPNRLELDERGFTSISVLGRRSRVEWRDCGPFRTERPDVDGSYRAPLQVVFDTRESDGHRLALLGQILAGGSAALPDTYGMSAADLADLLNRYRVAAGQDRSAT